MGQYFLIADLDKKEYLDPLIMGSGLKLWEICATRVGSALVYLLRRSSDRGGGDIHLEVPVFAGRWAGDRIVVIGDYDESHLFSEVSETFKEISEGVASEFNAFMQRPDLRLPIDEDQKRLRKEISELKKEGG